MLPDYPDLKKTIDKLLIRFLKEEMLRRSPILGEISRIRQHEGFGGVQRDVSGRSRNLEYEKVETEFSMTREEMRCGSFDQVIAKYTEMADEMAGAQTRSVLATVSDAASSVGNVVSAKGKPTRDAFLEMLEKLETDFDPVTGEPRRGSIVVSPETWATLKDDVLEWEADEDFKARLAEIDERKRVEWRDRESRRRLVD
jgi:hypothetical protein